MIIYRNFLRERKLDVPFKLPCTYKYLQATVSMFSSKTVFNKSLSYRLLKRLWNKIYLPSLIHYGRSEDENKYCLQSKFLDIEPCKWFQHLGFSRFKIALSVRCVKLSAPKNLSDSATHKSIIYRPTFLDQTYLFIVDNKKSCLNLSRDDHQRRTICRGLEGVGSED